MWKLIEINPNFGRLVSIPISKTIKLNPFEIEDKILASPIDFVNYVEIKMPQKEAKLTKDSFPLKKYESQKKTTINLSELNKKDKLAYNIYNE